MKFDNDMTLEQIRVLDVNDPEQTTISHSALKRLCKVLVDRDDLTIFSDDTETSIIDDETGEIVLIIPSDEPHEIGCSTPQQVIEKIRNTEPGLLGRILLAGVMPEIARLAVEEEQEALTELRLTKNTTNWKDEGF